MAAEWVQVFLAAIAIVVAIASIWAATVSSRAVRKGDVARTALQLMETLDAQRFELGRDQPLIDDEDSIRAHHVMKSEMAKAARVAVDEFAAAAIRPGVNALAAVLLAVLGYVVVLGAFGLTRISTTFTITLGLCAAVVGIAFIMLGTISLAHRSWRRDSLALSGIRLPTAREEIERLWNRRKVARHILKSKTLVLTETPVSTSAPEST